MEDRQTSIVGQAFFDGVIGWAAWPRAHVARLLPGDLELAPPNLGPPDRHPLLVAMGRQRDTAVVYGGVQFDVAVGYDECMLSVPFVRRMGGKQLHTFVALMVSGDRRATWSGNTHYGFGKRMGRIERFGDVWTATQDEGGLTMYAAMNPVDDWVRGPESASPSIRSIPRLFDAPVIGRRADGTYVASYFEWNLDHAVVRRVGLRLFFTSGVGLEPREVQIPPESGIELRGMRWRLGWPESPMF